MALAYETLSKPFTSMISGLSAWHSSGHVFGASQQSLNANRTGRICKSESATQDALHPAVFTHPLSGRKGLYVNPQFGTHIDWLSKLETDAILGCLYTHCQKPEFQFRVRLYNGNVTMWGNRATWHEATDNDHGHRRFGTASQSKDVRLQRLKQTTAKARYLMRGSLPLISWSSCQERL